MKLGAWLKLKEVNRREFAKKLGVSYTTLSGYCACRPPGLKRLINIHNMTGGEVSFVDFYGDRLTNTERE